MKVRKRMRASLFAALIAICAWIGVSVPPIAFTLQTLGVLTALGTLGGKWGAVSVGLYLAMGAVGLPVFSGFRGGAAALLGTSGGFLWGFGAGALVYWAAERLGKLPAMVLCQLTCYLCGCIWFSVYAGGGGILGAVLTCVVPWLIPDGVKLWLAFALSRRLEKHLKQ